MFKDIPKQGYKIRLRDETRVKIHEFLFSRGINWADGDSRITDKPFLYIDMNRRDVPTLLHGSMEDMFISNNAPEIFDSDFFLDLYDEEELNKFSNELEKKYGG